MVYHYTYTFSKGSGHKKIEEYQNQFRAYWNYISTLLRCSRYSYFKLFFEENKRDVKTVWKIIKELITIK